MLVLAAFALDIGLPSPEAAPAQQTSTQAQGAKALKQKEKQQKKRIKQMKRGQKKPPRRQHRQPLRFSSRSSFQLDPRLKVHGVDFTFHVAIAT